MRAVFSRGAHCHCFSYYRYCLTKNLSPTNHYYPRIMIDTAQSLSTSHPRLVELVPIADMDHLLLNERPHPYRPDESPLIGDQRFNCLMKEAITMDDPMIEPCF